MKASYCADEALRAPDILPGPICDDHLRRLILDFAPHDLSVMLCGPPRHDGIGCDTFLKLGVPIDNIHYERFDYGAGRGRIDRRRRFATLTILASLAAAGLAFSLRPA